MNFKSLDWRSLKRLASPTAASDFNAFLEKLPQTAGQSALIAAGIAWASGAAIGLYATIQAKQMTELRASLRDSQALKPNVPTVRDVPVPQEDVKNFSDILISTYPGLTVRQQGASLTLTSATTANFGQFREAIGHVQNGGTGWRVNVDHICVGRECPADKLEAVLKINKVSVEKN